MRIALTLAAGVLLGGLGLGIGAASAAPAMPALGMIAGGTVTAVRRRAEHPPEHVLHEDHRPHRSIHGHHHSTRAERRARRLNTHNHGDPNAHNPERPGYQQQLGNTTGGPRY